jgi:hypothetical protein
MTTESLPPEADGGPAQTGELPAEPAAREAASAPESGVPQPASVAVAAAGITADATHGVAVKFAGVERHYKDTVALAGLDLDIQPGEITRPAAPFSSTATTSPTYRRTSATWAWSSRPTACSRT